jgi:hypothetical protein
MKKHFIVVLLYVICIQAYSQPEKGRLITGGNIGFFITSDDTKTDTSSIRNSTVRGVKFLPMAGYFLSNNIAVGVRTGIDYRKEETPQALSQKKLRTMVEINPFARYYFWKYSSGNGLFSVAGAVGLFTDLSLSAGFGREKQYTGTDIVSKKMQNLSFGISPGIFYYLTNRFSFEAKLGWIGFKSETVDDGGKKNTVNNYGINLSPESFMLGVNFTF